MKRKSILRIGFDFDGVLVYNPVRIFRMPVSLFKRTFLKPKKLKFWLPKTSWQKFFWVLFHKTSVFPAIGYHDLLKLMKKGKIEGYIITARYDFLENDFKAWLKTYDPEKLFAGYFLNKKNEQPHQFKEKMIKELKLNYFVEDNWDIVNYLSSKLKENKELQIHWIYNLLDRKIAYSDKHPYLGRFLRRLKI